MVKAVKKLMQFVEFLVTVLFLISVVLVICQVFWRYVLRDPSLRLWQVVGTSLESRRHEFDKS